MDIKKELLEIISEFVELPDEEIDTSKAFKSALGADSFVFLSMLGSIEERFNIRIPNEDLLTFKTMDDIIGYLKKKVGP